MKSKAYTSLPMFKEESILLERRPEKSIVDSVRSKQQNTVVGNKDSQVKRDLDQRMKEIMPKLTMKRLRKMQALVRGFLTRRIILPPLLKKHKLCASVY